LGLPAPDHTLIREAIDAVLDGRDFGRWQAAITYTGGRGPLGSEAAYGPPTLIVALTPATACAATDLDRDGTVDTKRTRRTYWGEIHLVRGECSGTWVCG
jgi:branched-chain amino acid aminotransferase